MFLFKNFIIQKSNNFKTNSEIIEKYKTEIISISKMCQLHDITIEFFPEELDMDFNELNL